MTAAARREIIRRQHGECGFPWCRRDIESFHHMLKRSTYPQFVDDPDVQVGFCGEHHALCEAALLRGTDVTGMYPQDQWRIAQIKAGLI